MYEICKLAEIFCSSATSPLSTFKEKSLELKIKELAEHVLNGFNLMYNLSLQEINPEYFLLNVVDLPIALSDEHLVLVLKKLEDVLSRNFNVPLSNLNDFVGITLTTKDGRSEGNYFQ